MTSRYPGGLLRKNAANTAITGASGVWDLGSQAQAVKNNTWPISGLALPVSGSLRFRASATAYLNRTFGAPTNNKVWTWSAWVKRGSLSLADANHLFLGSPTDISGNPSTYGRLVFETDGTLRYQSAASGVATESFTSSAVYRDCSAWYHIVLYMDAVNTTVKGYVNGTEIAYASRTNPTNTNTAINGSGNYHRIGLFRSAETRCFDGYMAEVNFIDGQALTPASFGQTSPITGVWEPIKYTGTYGTNGFYLSLSDTSSIGKDFSGNGNNWTPNNISTTNDSTFDLMRDVPTQWAPQSVTDVGGVVRGNYCTLNPLNLPKGGTLSNGNLLWTTPTAEAQAVGTIYASSGKWYFEITPSTTSCGIGIANNTTNINSINLEAGSYTYYGSNGYKYNASSGSAYGATYTSGDIIGVALDLDTGTLVFYKNGISQGTAFTGLSGTFTALIYDGTSASTPTFNANFGQRPFTYTPPSGFKSLCSTNLPTPTIGATTATAANKYFDATLITGTAATQVITNAGGFQPDFVWLKSRTNANNPTIYDAIRGVNTVLYPALTNAEVVGSAQLTAFNSNGFTLGASENANDSSGEASVGWQWNAGGSTVTNTAGSITSQVRANPTAGFSIATYTGTGSAGTIGHGLGTTPAMIIVKQRNTTRDWLVYHQYMGANPEGLRMFLNLTEASGSSTLNWNNTAPTSSVFSVGAISSTNENSGTYVAYCFAPVAGFSAFGKYTGNGSTDGPFVYTGFRPRFVMVKNTIDPNNWTIFDSARNTYNILISQIYPTSDAEVTGSSTNGIDFLSNGFKIRSSNNWGNRSSDTIIYMAFAEHPFKYSLAR